MKGNLDYQVGHIWSKLDGIGESKAINRSNSTLKNINNSLPISSKVHSYRYKDEVLRTARDLGRFAISCNIKNLSKISFDLVDRWFMLKIEKNVSRDTLKNYLAHIAKIQLALERISGEESRAYIGYTRDDLLNILDMLNQLEKNGYINRAYKNPGALVSNLSGKEYYVGLLQYRYGFRVTEAKQIKLSQFDGNFLTVQGKGGYYLQKELSEDLVKSIIDSMEDGVFKINENRYRKNLERSALIEGEEYFGSHGLRYNYAQTMYKIFFKENLLMGLSPNEANQKAMKQTSEALGHHRAEIIRRYTGRSTR